MRASLLCLVALVVIPCVEAVPAPVSKAKERLETLKKRLPHVVGSWAKERWYPRETVEVRVVRMLGPSQAKVVLMSRASDGKGGPAPWKDKVFTIFLDFYNGV
jgi:hypothetical protein